jgi:hypothetical protein
MPYKDPLKLREQARRAKKRRRERRNAPWLEKQGNKCGICGRLEPLGKGGWHLDHDHITGRIRGLLCHHCNVGLGHFGDSQEMLLRAVRWLAG